MRSRLSLDLIDDVMLRGNHAEIRLRSGEIVRVKLSNELIELYWKVKLRNRRRAFGL